MAQPYLSEIRIFSFNFAPRTWAQCNGQLLPINQNQALFSLLGTTYGGNGQTTFALPNLQTKNVVHVGNGFTQGQTGGEATHLLTQNEMPAHTHTAVASSNAPNNNSSQNNFWATNTGYNAYSTTTNEALGATALSNAGSAQAHSNMAPYLVVNICIALQGIFPSRT